MRVLVALVTAVALLATVLGSLALLRPARGRGPGEGVRLSQVGGVYGLATGRGAVYRVHLPRDWGVAAVPADRWVQVARRRSCEAAVLSALELAAGPAAATLKERASALLWQVLGRAAEPGATVTAPIRLGTRRAIVAADLHARTAVLAVAVRLAGSPRAVAVIVEGVAGPGPGCDHRSVRLTPEHLGNLVAGVEDPPPGLD